MIKTETHSHLCVADSKLPSLVCVPEQLTPEPIKLPVVKMPTVHINSDLQSWIHDFYKSDDVLLTVWFPGQKTAVPNRPWRETESGEKFVGARGIHLECSIPPRLSEATDQKSRPVDVVWTLFANVVERLMVSIRWRTGQFWIGRTPYIIGLDLEATWYDAERNRSGTCSGSAGSLPYWGDKEPVKPLGLKEWKQVETDLQTEEEPHLYQTFLWDARHSMDGNDVIRGVLYAAVGLEIFTKEFYTKYGGARDAVYKWLVERRDEKQPAFHEYYDSLALCLCGRSLKQDKPDTFQWVRKLFETRNKIMHEGRAYRRSGQTEYEAHQASLAEMLLAAEAAIDWLTQCGRGKGQDIS